MPPVQRAARPLVIEIVDLRAGGHERVLFAVVQSARALLLVAAPYCAT